MPDYTQFKRVDNIGDFQPAEQVRDNLIAFLNNGFLCIGAFIQVTRPAVGKFGNNFSSLRPIDGGSTWEGFRANWVWEKNIEYSTQPLNVGVYANNTYVSGVTINYPQGRVVFPSPILPTTKVEADFSYRYVNTYSADDEVFRQIQTNSFRTDINFTAGSGSWNIDSRNRVQLPAVFVEMVPGDVAIPKELGSDAVYWRKDVLFHVVTEKAAERNNIMDILENQREKKIYLFDKNRVAASGAYPLNVAGVVVNTNNYQYLVENYTWTSLYFVSTRSQEIMDYIPGLHMGVVRATIEIDY